MTCMLLMMTAGLSRAATNDFLCQTITLPTNVIRTLFASLNKNGISDLLALDPVGRKVFIYRQRASGFSYEADEVITLPKRTTWLTPFDVDATPGQQLLMSTPDGLFYFRQNGGKFETEARILTKAPQVFTNDDSPLLVRLTNDFVPVISATQVVLYTRDNHFQSNNSAPMPLELKRTSAYTYANEWTMGQNSSRSLHVERSWQSNSRSAENTNSEPDAIRKILDHIRKSGQPRPTERLEIDVNGDGRKDLIVWQLFPALETRIEVYVFLRGRDGKLPDEPSQTLRCQGFPLPIGQTDTPAPVVDLKGDGSYEVVLLEIKTVVASVGGMIDMALSGGLELAITIRPFNHGVFAGTPTAAIPIKAILPITSLAPTGATDQWPFFICGDFNGDGRADLVVQRSARHWEIYFSTNDRRWFAAQPEMSFETPFEGVFEVKDLNGDGRADIILRDSDGNRIAVLFSQGLRRSQKNL